MVALALLILLKCGENILWAYLIQSTTPHTESMDRLSEVSDIQNISPDDIDNVLKQLNIGKSAGADHNYAC